MIAVVACIVVRIVVVAVVVVAVCIVAVVVAAVAAAENTMVVSLKIDPKLNWLLRLVHCWNIPQDTSRKNIVAVVIEG